MADSVVPLIKTRRTGLLYQVDYLKFREILQEVKPDLPKGQATHVMRHTFATHFMMNGETSLPCNGFWDMPLFSKQ